MKIDFIADTNFLIYIHEGNELVESFLEYNFGISFISEVELLGFKNITKSDEAALKNLIKDCFYIDWSPAIKDKTIEIKRKYSVKLPDAIIAATSILYGIPLVTYYERPRFVAIPRLYTCEKILLPKHQITFYGKSAFSAKKRR